MELSIKDIFRSAFGYEMPENKFQIPEAPARVTNGELGSPYYGEDVFGREFFLPVTIDGYLIPFAVVGMTWKKTIVSTSMPERGGNVNELINIDDYTINIKGILLNRDNVFPEAQIMDLFKLFQKNASLTLRSVITDIILSGAYEHKVIIKEIKWPAVSGVEHAKAFEMDVVSDMAFDLEIE